MKLFSRYVLRSYIVPLVLAWSVLTGIFLMDRLFLLFDLLIRKGVELRFVFEILLYSLPFVMAMSVPLAALAGSMMTFGRMAQDNEILSVRSAGARLFSTFIPVLLFSLILAGLMVYFNLFVLPEANHRVRNLLTDVSSKKPTIKLEAGVTNEDFPGYTIYIGDKNEKESRIYKVMIFVKRGDPFPTLITAPEGIIATTPDKKYMQITLFDSEVHELSGENYRVIKTDTQTINFEIDTDFMRRQRENRSEREMTLPLLSEDIRKSKKSLTEYTEKLKHPANEVEEKELERRIESVQTRINRLQVEIHKNIAFALAGLLFLCFGAALGGKLRRSEIGFAIVLSLVFFAFYYILLIGGESLAKTGKLKAWLALWLPNLIFLPFTAELFAEVFFEKSLIKRRIRT